MGSRGFISQLRWILPIVVVLIFLGFATIWWANISTGELPVLGTIPHFSFTERSGDSFGRNNLNDKISIVSWGFTSCPSVCPTMNGYIFEMYNEFADSPEIQFVTITVDPSRDSLPVLWDYAESLGVTDNRWVFLWAPIDSVVKLSEEGFMIGAEDLPDGHTFRLTLIDTKGRIRGYYDGLDETSLRVLRDHIRLIAREES
ncbi:MAG: SCO family protein [Candidatus Zixiibacteriota bacterium]